LEGLNPIWGGRTYFQSEVLDLWTSKGGYLPSYLHYLDSSKNQSDKLWRVHIQRNWYLQSTGGLNTGVGLVDKG